MCCFIYSLLFVALCHPTCQSVVQKPASQTPSSSKSSLRSSGWLPEEEIHKLEELEPASLFTLMPAEPLPSRPLTSSKTQAPLRLKPLADERGTQLFRQRSSDSTPALTGQFSRLKERFEAQFSELKTAVRNTLTRLTWLALLMVVILWQVQRIVGATGGLTATGLSTGLSKVVAVAARFLTGTESRSGSSPDTSPTPTQEKQSGQESQSTNSSE